MTILLIRRFHAQPNACPVCGPKIALWDDQGKKIATTSETLPAVAELIKRGMIVAVKALGGFYLMADALNDEAVALLRQRKARPHKPLALMMPSLEMTARYCDLSPLEVRTSSIISDPYCFVTKKSRGSEGFPTGGP